MIQLAFGIVTDNAKQSWFSDAIRFLLSVFDRVVYELMVIIYKILFNIANSTIVSSETIKFFFLRIQLIIGVFMIFKLAISVLQAIINPDILSDQKKGMGKIITRIITMLAMFTAIMPLNIPNAEPGTYNSYLNQNGLLFGTMYSLQARILNNGVIPKLILGSTDNTRTDTSQNSNSNISIDDNANQMSTYILKAFVRINVKKNADINVADGDSGNYMIPEDDLKNDDEAAYEVWLSDDSSPGDILDYINATDGKKYAYSYCPLLPTICGGLVIFVLVGFCIDVAIRALKLAILRLIAPIPILSYIDPKSSENGAFANWVKLLMTTFLNLFIILAIVYFVIFLVGEITKGNFEIPISDGVSIVGLLSTVFIIIGLFYFARQAPKFIMDALGIKSLGLGAGLSGVLGAAGALMGGGGLSGISSGFMNASTQAAEAAAQGKQAPPAYSSQRDRMEQLLTGNKDARGGFLGHLTQMATERNAANMAERVFGINRNKVAEAKNLKYAMASAASEAKNRYERLAQGKMTKDEIANIESGEMFTDFLAAEGITAATYSTYSDDQKNALLIRALEDDWSSKETASAKQNAWFEEGAKVMETMGINETFQEKYSARGRRRARRLYDRNLPNNTYRDPNTNMTYRGNRQYNVSHENRRK